MKNIVVLTHDLLNRYTGQRFVQEFGNSPMINEGIVRSVRLRDRTTLDLKLTTTRRTQDGKRIMVDGGQQLSLLGGRYGVSLTDDDCLVIRYKEIYSGNMTYDHWITLMHHLPSVVDLKNWFIMESPEGIDG